jgi:predicted dinucleotide-binding enzyme
VARRVNARYDGRMKIGIIGAGNIGGALAKKLVALGHGVVIANSRGPDTLKEIAADTGARAVAVHDAVKDVELVIVTVPQKSVPLLPAGLFRDVPASVVVADTGNYYPTIRDGVIPEIENGTSESAWVVKVLDRSVVKVFNNIMTASLVEGGRPKGASDRIALPVAGDDARGKALLLELVDALGFDGVDGGNLDESWRQQPGTPVYCTDLGADGVRRALASADRVIAPKRRDLALEKLSQLAPRTRAELIAIIREIEHAPV